MDKPHEHGKSFQCRVTSEAATKSKSSPGIEYTEVENENIYSSQLEMQPKHKILIQRVFHQPIKDVVEQKLDYVVAKSDEEITKHVFGGLFKNKYYPYRPENYCRKHDPNLFEQIDETLPKLGDKFDSLETFRLYIDSNAKQWKYYLKCADSHRGNGKSTFVFKCVFSAPRTQYFNAKGLRKRTAKLPKGTCPCRVILKPVPDTADTLTVIYVCNHHDHQLTDEDFEKLQHGRRIHPSVKEELMDLLSLDVDREVVKKYFESLTGYKMESTYFSNLFAWMKKNNIERQFSLEKLKEMSRKVEKIKEELGIADKHGEEEIIEKDWAVPDKVSQIQEAINVLRAVAAPKKPLPKSKLPRNTNVGRKRPKIMRKPNDEEPDPPVSNKSRLETRLQELTYDHETLQSIKHLQDLVRGDTDQHELELWNRSITEHRKNRIKNPQKQTPVVEPEFEPQTVVIENTQNVDAYGENQDIIYENEITVMETPEENYNEIIVYQNQDDNNGTEIVDTENEVSYCIQYEDGTVAEQQADEQYILLESLENVPEVHIQATQLATVSIVSQKEDVKMKTKINEDQNQNENFDEIHETKNDVTMVGNNKVQSVKVESDNIKVLGDTDATLALNTDTLYEVIKTDDKKIFPSREVVRNVILNKPLPSKISKKRSDVPKEACVSTKPFAGLGTSNHRKRQSGNLNSLVKSFVKEEDLEGLEDDEYYMVVVDNDEMDESSQDDTSFLDGEYDNYKIKSLDKELESCTSEDLISDETIDKSTVYCVNKKVQCSFVSAKDIDSELKTIKRLKRMRESLEQDVKRLVATKEGLVKDIMNVKRLKRPIEHFD